MTNFLIWIVFGLVAGVIAKFLKPGADSQGWLGTIIVGIVGSVLGGFLGRMFFGQDVTNHIFSLYNMGMAVIGSILVLYGYNAMTKRA